MHTNNGYKYLPLSYDTTSMKRNGEEEKEYLHL